jgi:hypothetical protein
MSAELAKLGRHFLSPCRKRAKKHQKKYTRHQSPALFFFAGLQTRALPPRSIRLFALGVPKG